jgi:hypothetical protein
MSADWPPAVESLALELGLTLTKAAGIEHRFLEVIRLLERAAPAQEHQMILGLAKQVYVVFASSEVVTCARALAHIPIQKAAPRPKSWDQESRFASIWLSRVSLGRWGRSQKDREFVVEGFWLLR